MHASLVFHQCPFRSLSASGPHICKVQCSQVLLWGKCWTYMATFVATFIACGSIEIGARVMSTKFHKTVLLLSPHVSVLPLLVCGRATLMWCNWHRHRGSAFLKKIENCISKSGQKKKEETRGSTSGSKENWTWWADLGSVWQGERSQKSSSVKLKISGYAGRGAFFGLSILERIAVLWFISRKWLWRDCF